MQAPNNGLIATEHSAGRGGSSLNQVPAGRNSSLSTCIIAAVNTWWEKRTAIDRACTAAEDATPVIAQAPIPSCANTLERAVESAAEGARDAAAFPNSQAKGQRGAPRAARHVVCGCPQAMTPNTPTSLRDLEHHGAFIERHIGPDDAEIAQMLRVIGHDSLESMTDAIVPGSIKSAAPLALPEAITEEEALAKIRMIADRNQVFRSFIGQGYYGTLTPNVILRNILENPAWYTAYTPYQAEISQGRMEALINFQTMCADLTGMEIANASLLDEATAAAE